MDLIYFILVCYGLTQILCFSIIFDKFRPSHHFFHCPMCVGFWVGLIVWVLSGLTGLFIFDYSIITGFFLACLSSGTSYILNMMVCDNGLQLAFNNTDTEEGNVPNNN